MKSLNDSNKRGKKCHRARLRCIRVATFQKLRYLPLCHLPLFDHKTEGHSVWEDKEDNAILVDLVGSERGNQTTGRKSQGLQ